jgi:hypothetical protein
VHEAIVSWLLWVGNSRSHCGTTPLPDRPISVLHSATKLRERARQSRERASEARDPNVNAELLQVATAFEEEAVTVEREGTFEDGYQEGWSSVAGTDVPPENPTQPLPSEERTPDKGYMYGRSDAKEADES